MAKDRERGEEEEQPGDRKGPQTCRGRGLCRETAEIPKLGVCAGRHHVTTAQWQRQLTL